MVECPWVIKGAHPVLMGKAQHRGKLSYAIIHKCLERMPAKG